MRWWLSIFILFAWTGTAPAQQSPGPVAEPEGVWRGQIHWVPLDIGGIRYLLYARVCRPAGETPARVVVIAHGTPPKETERPTMAPTHCEGEAAQWFLQRGFVVVAAMRRGYGASPGPYAEGGGPCGDRDYTRAALESARDVAATVEYAAALPFARSSGMILVGQSAGGWAAIGYNAMPHPRVTAMISMAGGRGGHYQQQPNSNCQPERLAMAAGALAGSATTPMLWIYTENDSFFAPTIASAMYEAFSRNGGRAEFHQLGPFGEDGHRLFFARTGSQIWGPLVERYLASRPPQ